jgi:hypothetical protein
MTSFEVTPQGARRSFRRSTQRRQVRVGHVPTRYAEFVQYKDAYWDERNQFECLPDPVFLRYALSAAADVLPIGLIGRIIRRHRDKMIDVWFWNRGVYKIAADVVGHG